MLSDWSAYAGRTGDSAGFDLLLFRAATGVLFSLVAQIGEQVLTNLIMNTLRYAYDEDEIENIRIEARVDDGDIVEIRYSDDGKGIAEHLRSKIFEPFFTTKRSEGGSGLGLYLVYNIVTQKLKGTIDVESAEGKGTTFTVRMPRRHSSRPAKMTMPMSKGGIAND